MKNMKDVECGNLGIEINKNCFNNQATFGREADKDIAPIRYKKNKKIPFNEACFAVRVKKIINGQDCYEKLTNFLNNYSKLKIESIGQNYIVHD
jgi:hypothetical protein